MLSHVGHAHHIHISIHINIRMHADTHIHIYVHIRTHIRLDNCLYKSMLTCTNTHMNVKTFAVSPSPEIQSAVKHSSYLFLVWDVDVCMCIDASFLHLHHYRNHHCQFTFFKSGAVIGLFRKFFRKLFRKLELSG